MLRMAACLGWVALACVVGCNKKTTPSEQSSVSAQPAGPVAPSASAPQPPAARFHVLARSASSIHVLPGAEEALLYSVGVFYRLKGQQLSQDADLLQGLHPMHYWGWPTLLGAWPNAAYWLGTNENPLAEKDYTADDVPQYMQRFSTAWGKLAAVNGQEVLGGVAEWKDGRFIAPIELDSHKDYRMALVAGKPGVALPIPLAVPKPETAGATPPASASAEAPAPNAEAPAPSAEAPAPSPTQPSSDNACQTQLLPLAAGGDGQGHLVVLGKDCESGKNLLAEVWRAGERRSQLSSLDALVNAEGMARPWLVDRYVVRVAGEHAVVAERNATLLKELNGGAWHSIELPKDAAKVTDVAYGAGALWLATPSGLFVRKADTWEGVDLPQLEGQQLQPEEIAFQGDKLLLVASTKGTKGTKVLLIEQAPPKFYELAEAYFPKTAREEVPAASSACTSPYVILRGLTTPKDKLDDDLARLGKLPELKGLSLVVDAWKNGTLLGVQASDYEAGKRIVAAAGGKARLTCREPQVLRTVALTP